jgi:hypothetical protein
MIWAKTTLIYFRLPGPQRLAAVGAYAPGVGRFTLHAMLEPVAVLRSPLNGKQPATPNLEMQAAIRLLCNRYRR